MTWRRRWRLRFRQWLRPRLAGTERLRIDVVVSKGLLDSNQSAEQKLKISRMVGDVARKSAESATRKRLSCPS